MTTRKEADMAAAANLWTSPEIRFQKLEEELIKIRTVKAATREHVINVMDDALAGGNPSDWIDLKTLMLLSRNEKIIEAKMFGAITPLIKDADKLDFTSTVELPDRETDRKEIAEQVGRYAEVIIDAVGDDMPTAEDFMKEAKARARRSYELHKELGLATKMTPDQIARLYED